MKYSIETNSKAAFLYSKYTRGYITKNQYIKAYDLLVKEIREKVSSSRRSLCLVCSKSIAQTITAHSVCSPECWLVETTKTEMIP